MTQQIDLRFDSISAYNCAKKLVEKHGFTLSVVVISGLQFYRLTKQSA